jgi:hypothetical protein
MGFTDSASFSFETETLTEDGGANVGYFVDVSRRNVAMSTGEALV